MVLILSSKGQITLPKDLRERLTLQIGDKVKFLNEGGSGDFADYMIAVRNRDAGCAATYIFNKKAATDGFGILVLLK